MLNIIDGVVHDAQVKCAIDSTEIVGKSLDKFGDHYETPTSLQQQSLQWLIAGLLKSLHMQRTDIYRHPEISRKGAGEAANAVW